MAAVLLVVVLLLIDGIASAPFGGHLEAAVASEATKMAVRGNIHRVIKLDLCGHKNLNLNFPYPLLTKVYRAIGHWPIASSIIMYSFSNLLSYYQFQPRSSLTPTDPQQAPTQEASTKDAIVS